MKLSNNVFLVHGSVSKIYNNAENMAYFKAPTNLISQIKYLESSAYAEDGEKYSVKFAVEYAKNKRLKNQVKNYVKQLDDLYGTPCEQIRHEQELDALKEENNKFRAILGVIYKTLDDMGNI